MSIKRRHPEEGENAAGQESIHPSRRRRVEYTEQDKKLAALYNDLADDVKTTRLKAAAELVRTVSGDVQRIDGALTRLIRGLCSSRKAARAGFSIALSEVFRLTGELKEKTVDAVDLRVPALTERIVKITSPEATSNSKVSRDGQGSHDSLLTIGCRSAETIFLEDALHSKVLSRAMFSSSRAYLLRNGRRCLSSPANSHRRRCGYAENAA